MRTLIKFILGTVPRRHIQRIVHWVMPVVGVLYAGRRVCCPVCGRRYRKMLPYGYVVSRPNALCPGCLSLERHRLMWLWLRDRTDLFSSHPRVLHIAPERCFISRFEKMFGDDYITADLESPLAKLKMDVRQIPFSDNSFDVVICNHLLEHIDDDRLAMREILRVMRHGGWGVMMCPVNPDRENTYEDPAITTPEGRLGAYGQADHMREYGRDYPERLRGEGFDVDCVDYTTTLGTEKIAYYAIRPDIIYRVRKPRVESMLKK